jgi:NTE family protein
MKETCLILSGGGARGFAHVGAIKALTELHVPINKIIASSMGAVIGAKFALTKDVNDIERLCLNFSENAHEYLDFSHGIRIRKGKLRDFFDKVYSGSYLYDTKVPLQIIVSEYESGKTKALVSGEITDQVLASISIPFLNHPVEIDGNFYCDPGFISNFPVEYYEKRDGILVGINFGSNKLSPRKLSHSFMDKLVKKNDIYNLIYSNNHLKKLYEKEKVRKYRKYGIIVEADNGMDNYNNNDFGQCKELIKAGYNTVMQKKEEILEKVK